MDNFLSSSLKLKTNRRDKTNISNLEVPYINNFNLMKRIKSRNNYKCFICRQDFPSLITRICHVKLHFFKNYGSCLLCGYSSNIFLEYWYHLITHSVLNKLTYSRIIKKTEQESTISVQVRHQNNTRQNCIYSFDKNCSSSQRDNKPDCRMCKYCGSMKVTLIHNCHICESCLKKNHLGLHLSQSKNFKIKCRCYLCKKQFDKKTKLVNHVRVHFSCSSFSCDFCNRRFFNKNNWKSHVELHKRKSEYKCNVCDVSFDAKYFLNWHLQQHNLNLPYQCEVCKQLFLFKNLLIQHNLHHHSYAGSVKNNTFLCTYCKQEFSELDYLKQHLSEQIGNDTYKCNICDQPFKSPINLSKHMNRHLAIKKYVGQICHKAFQLKIEPLDPSEVKIEHNELEICDNIIKWETDLNIFEEPMVLKKENEHKVSLDDETEDYNFVKDIAVITNKENDLISNSMDYKCSTCFQQFKDNETFIAHIKTHRDVIQCGTCCQEFENMECLVGHMKVHMKNIEKKAFECSTCFQLFQDNENLLDHAKMHLTNIECSTCHQVFGDHESLINHAAIHITTFECPTCFKQFEDREGLDNHVKVHSIKMECSTCFQNFKDYDCLVDHIKMHVDGTFQECIDENSVINPSETECLQSVKCEDNVGPVELPVRQKKSKCSKKYKDKESSTVSVKKKRPKITKCLACLKEFPNKWRLNSHVRNLECPDRFNPIHKKNIKCATCSKQFQSNESFISHILTHSMTENDEKSEIKVEELSITEKVETANNENEDIGEET